MGHRVALLVPGEDVLHLAATLPSGSDARLAQLLPFALEEQIAEAQASPSVDDIAIVAMKRRKLALKDQIFRLRNAREEEKQTRH